MSQPPPQIVVSAAHAAIPRLCIDHQAEEAARFYLAAFGKGRIVNTLYYSEGMHGPAGTVLAIVLELDGLSLELANGGPHFTFTQGISLCVACKDQAEIDHLWEALAADGGRQEVCGWLVDKFGLSWQIVPETMMDIMSDPDTVRTQRVLRALFAMTKLDMAAIQRAYDGIDQTA